jgi:hypothetical protein
MNDLEFDLELPPNKDEIILYKIVPFETEFNYKNKIFSEL